jgi:hypothetical protein
LKATLRDVPNDPGAPPTPAGGLVVLTLIDVRPGGLTDAICETVRRWSDAAEAGQLRITPNPLNPCHYLILTGGTIVATLRIVDPDNEVKPIDTSPDPADEKADEMTTEGRSDAE